MKLLVFTKIFFFFRNGKQQNLISIDSNKKYPLSPKSQYYWFYYIFDQINAVLVSIRNFFQKHLKIYLFLTFGQQYVYMLFLMFSVCCVFFSDRFDSHDERDDDGEGESVEEHKSVIMHLLSQVRLGMDLTKVNTTTFSYFLHSHLFFSYNFHLLIHLCHPQVVLPTFILERRSLLEMYADFFAHPDLFVR